jgi:hypothetical protein
MKKKLLYFAAVLLLTTTVAQGQNKVMQVHSGGDVVYEINTLQVDSVVFRDDTSTGLEGRFDINKDEFITMRVSPKEISVNSPMKLIIENKAKGELFFGRVFSLEYFDKENWEEIQLDIIFEFIGIILSTGKTEEELFNTSEEFFSKSGRYRIVKRFTYFSNFLSREDSVISFELYAEFEVKQN